MEIYMSITGESFDYGTYAFIDTYNPSFTSATFDRLSIWETEELIDLTLQFLFLTKVNYHQFFGALKQKFSEQWRDHPDPILQDLEHLVSGEEIAILKRWCWLYHQLLVERSPSVIKEITDRLQRVNPGFRLFKSEIESIWKSIIEDDNWKPFINFLELIRLEKFK